MSDIVEKVAFALWNSEHPPHIAEATTLEMMGEIVTPLGDGDTLHLDLKMDWEMNRDTFRKMASVAIAEIERHKAAEGK